MIPKNLASLEWLNNNIDHPHVVIVDCRFVLGRPTNGYQAYLQGHIPGAVYVDLEKDMSAPIGQHGGRHPLPNLQIFAKKLGDIGVDRSKKVVAYDDQGGVMAARLWWLLKYLGHEHVVVLREGYTAWKEKGYPTTSEIKQKAPTSFEANVQQHLLATMEEVREKLEEQDVMLIDSRSKERYLGQQETIDPVAGHIPGAVLEFWQDSLTAEGTWKTTTEQKERLRSYVEQQDKELIIYCGSGVTACANFVAFQEAGLQPKLYLGSWSDWISYPENKLAK